MYIEKKPGKNYIKMHIVAISEVVQIMDIIISTLYFPIYLPNYPQWLVLLSYMQQNKTKPDQQFKKGPGNYEQVCTTRFPKQK